MTGKQEEIYLLFEHKSIPDPGFFLQMLDYLARIPEGQKEAKPVIPFVFNHGETGWKQSNEFLDEFELSEKEREVFGKYIPGFSLEIFDLTTRDISALRESLLVYAFLSTIHDPPS